MRLYTSFPLLTHTFTYVLCTYTCAHTHTHTQLMSYESPSMVAGEDYKVLEEEVCSK